MERAGTFPVLHIPPVNVFTRGILSTISDFRRLNRFYLGRIDVMPFGEPFGSMPQKPTSRSWAVSFHLSCSGSSEHLKRAVFVHFGLVSQCSPSSVKLGLGCLGPQQRRFVVRKLQPVNMSRQAEKAIHRSLPQNARVAFSCLALDRVDNAPVIHVGNREPP